MESLSSEDKIIAVLITIFFIVCFIFVCLALMKKRKLNIGIKDRNENTIMIKQTQPVSLQQDKKQVGGFGEEPVVNIEQPPIQQNPMEQIPITEPIQPVNIEPIQQIMNKVNKIIESKTLGGKISEVDSTDFE